MKVYIFNLFVAWAPGSLKVFVLKRLGAKIGKNCHIGKKAFIMVPSFGAYKNVTIGENFSLGNNSTVSGDKIHIKSDVKIERDVQIASKDLHIGNNTSIAHSTSITARESASIGDDCIIYNQVVIGGGQLQGSSLILGNGVHVYPYCYLNTTKPLTIEDGVGIGGGSYIFTHGSWQDAYEGFPYAFAPVTIKKNAWLPWRVFVMPGVTIGEEATIGSDALVAKNIPDRSFAVGVPAKVVKTGDQYIRVMDNQSKQALISEIFSEFSKYMKEFHNTASTLKTDNNELSLVFSDGYTMKYSLHETTATPNSTLLTELPENTTLTGNIFDLKGKCCLHPLNTREDIFKGFVSNYGIRFTIKGKYHE